MGYRKKKQYAVLTTGTSFLSGNNVFSKYKDQLCDEKQWSRLIKEKLSENPAFLHQSISAEMTVMRSWQQQDTFYDAPAEIHLVHSDTPNGEAAATGVGACLKELYPNVCVRYHRIAGLNMNEPKTMMQGMHELVRVLNDLFSSLEEAKGQVIFAPIGGYKTITMLAHLVGELNGYEAWYQFEDSSHLVSVPRMPLKLNMDSYTTGEVRDAIQRFYCLSDYSFNGILEWDQLPDEMKQEVENYPEVFYRDEDLITFSPFLADKLKAQGYHYFPSIYVSEAKSLSLNAELNILVNQFLSDWSRYAEKRENKKYRDTMHHEYQWSDVAKGNEYSLYRMSCSPEYRAIYYLSPDKRSIYLKKIWTNHGEYDRDVKKLSATLGHDFRDDGYTEIPRTAFSGILSAY